MADEELTRAVLHHIAKFLERDLSHVGLNDNLAASIDGMTSLKMVELVLYLEECFGVEFDETVAERIDSVNDLVDFIQSHRK